MKPKKSESLKQFLSNNAAILFLYSALLFPSLYLIFNYEKLNVHLFFNEMVGSNFVNAFFYYITYLGDGLFALFILIAICFNNLLRGLYTTITWILASLFTQFLKHFVFEDVDRPLLLFQQKQIDSLQLIEGVDNHIHNSFPSGHATQAFAIFICLAFSSKNKLLKFVFFILASLTAFSRVYISQHWLNDIVAGSFIGLLFSILHYFLFYQHPKLNYLNRPLFSKAKRE